jgi:hypothetical protein
MKTILELNEYDSILSHIYIIRNIITNKVYIGQAVSHRLNKNKYRIFGLEGRFRDHISEALTNTKKNQCTYLNNSIRKYNKENFNVELVEICNINESDEKEQEYIKMYNSLYPNGYNLTKGGKNFMINNATNDKFLHNELNEKKFKRGRDFGFVHNNETIKKMKSYYADRKNDKEFQIKLKSCMSNTISTFYEKKKIQYLSEQKLILPLKQYIKPVYKRNTNIIHNFIIKINNKKIKIVNNDTLEDKYNKLLNILNESYKINNNCNDIPKG